MVGELFSFEQFHEGTFEFPLEISGFKPAMMEKCRNLSTKSRDILPQQECQRLWAKKLKGSI